MNSGSEMSEAASGIVTESTRRPRTLGEFLSGCAILLLIGLVVLAFLLPAVRQAREPARRTQCKNNLKQIGLALHLYHDTWHTFPPAYTVDAEGRRLHSWRVLLLPYLDRNDVYEKIDLNKPWDDPVHSELRKTAIAPFICPSNPSLPSRTSYLAVVGDELAFTGEHPQKISDFTDGAGETITVIEVSEGQSIEWMDPHDADEPMFLSFVQTEKTSHTGGGHVLLADGAVRFVSSKTPVETRRALLTRSAHDSVGEF